MNRVRRSHLWLGLTWSLANALGGAIVGALEASYFQFAATLLLTGPILGTAQWLVLRNILPRTGWWALASTLGWFVGIQVQIASNRLLDPLVAQLTSTGLAWEVFWLNLLKEPVVAAVLGSAQVWVLRRYVARAKVWILIAAIAGAVNGAVSATVCLVACQPVSAIAGGVAATAITMAAGWGAFGVVTGVGLVHLLSQVHRTQI